MPATENYGCLPAPAAGASGTCWARSQSRRAIEIAEQFAEGGTNAEQLARARAAARQVTWDAIQRVRTEWSLPRVNDQARVAWVAVWAACAAEETAEVRIWSEAQPRQGYLNSGSCLPLRTAQVVSWAQHGGGRAWSGPQQDQR